jgi:DNA-binding CsgD family transcriptional regulator
MSRGDLREGLRTAIKASLDRWSPGADAALKGLCKPLRELLGAEIAVAHCINRERRLEFLYADGIGPELVAARIADMLERSPGRFAGYDVERPAPRDRNAVCVATRSLSVEERLRFPVYRDVLHPLALHTHDQVRVLICDGPSLLAWVGALREEPFTRAELRRFASLIPSLKRRLTLERQVDIANLSSAALPAVLEAIPAAAFVLGPTGAISFANSAGAQLVQSKPRTSLELRERVLRRALRAAPFAISPFEARGMGTHHLAVLQRPAGATEGRLAEAARRWGLTRRQSQVLGLLAQGKPNKAIADALGCAESTVELHVTSALRKAGCASRAELAALFWR